LTGRGNEGRIQEGIKKLTMLKRGCSLFCGYCLLFCGNRKKHRLKRKNGMRKKTGIKYET
jgi:hypothetical protein